MPTVIIEMLRFVSFVYIWLFWSLIDFLRDSYDELICIWCKNAKNIERISHENIICEGFHGLVTFFQGKWTT